jgi:hypothetical protein
VGTILVVITIVIVAAAAGLLQTNKVENSVSFSSPSPAITPTASPTSFPTLSPRNNISNQRDISDYIYPNSRVNSRTHDSLDLTSTDNPDTIANWYKDRIKSKNMNVNTFVMTKSNDKVVDKLVGQSQSASVNIEINKEAGDSTVTMKVHI